MLSFYWFQFLKKFIRNNYKKQKLMFSFCYCNLKNYTFYLELNINKKIKKIIVMQVKGEEIWRWKKKEFLPILLNFLFFFLNSSVLLTDYYKSSLFNFSSLLPFSITKSPNLSFFLFFQISRASLRKFLQIFLFFLFQSTLSNKILETLKLAVSQPFN